MSFDGSRRWLKWGILFLCCAGLLGYLLAAQQRRIPAAASAPVAPPFVKRMTAATPVAPPPFHGPPVVDASRVPQFERDESLANGALSGWIVEKDSNRAVAGAELTFASLGAIHLTRTGDDGRFDFRPPSPGTYLLIGVTASGFAPRLWALNEDHLSFEFSRGHRVAGVRLSLEKRVSCRGRTEFEDGGAADGVTVKTMSWEVRETPVNLAENATVSGDGGAFELLCARSEDVEGVLEGFESRLSPRGDFVVVLTPELRAAPPLTIEGQVVNDRRAPVADALVWARGPLDDAHPDFAAGFPATCDSDGRFVVKVQAAGKYDLEVMHRQLKAGQKTAFEPGATGVVLETTSEGTIEVRAVDAITGEPVPHFEFHLAPIDGSTALRGKELIGATEAVRLDHVSVGDYLLFGAANGYADCRDFRVTVREATSARAELRFAPGKTVHGRVQEVVTGRPIALAAVTINRNDFALRGALEGERTALTDADGHFSLVGINPRSRFRVSAPGFHSWVYEAAPDGNEMLFELSRQEADAGEREEYGGVGLQWDDEPPPTVSLVMSGGPAERAGIRQGDRVLLVNGEAVVSVGDALRTIRGPVGTPVRLTLQRPDAGTMDLTLIRERILAP